MSAQQPWARVAGLLAACMTTLIGIWNGIEPEEILLRAAVAAIAIAILTNLMRLLMVPSERRRSSR